MICLCIPLNPYGWHVLFRSLPIQPPYGFCMHNFEHPLHPLYQLHKCFADIFYPMLTSYCKEHTDKLLLICIILLYKPPIKETMVMGIVRRWSSHVTNFNHDIHNTYSVKRNLSLFTLYTGFRKSRTSLAISLKHGKNLSKQFCTKISES